MDRHDNEEARKKVRNTFSITKIQKQICSKTPELGEIFTLLYERSIDYGAHPNERGASLSTEIKHLDDGGVEFGTIYLHADGMQLDFAVRSAAQVGLWVLRIAQEIYPLRTQALGMDHVISDLCRRF
ncbi:MAG: hypothetical protein JJ869_05655 [Marivita sp.]|uniref:hypothetical protein n=1 Tax=Marivita sp. TaxID=2003365 RepID=UPI001B251C7C|nr:hypothetical protein [Marivita sp.]MBO6883053.1 hypothetical protein [Marivita sp.]